MISTPLEKRERIERIVAKPPQPTGEEIDFIERSFGDVVLLRFFAELADSLEWLEWATGRDAFKRIFQTSSSWSECDEVLAGWFAEKYAVAHAGTALDIVRRFGSLQGQPGRVAGPDRVA